MLTHWNDDWSHFHGVFEAMSQLRQQMDRLFDESFAGQPLRAGTWPRTNLIDAGQNLLLTAEVPGLSESDVQLTLQQELLTISGERKTWVPEGYSVHRQERPAIRFSRSFSLPCRVNAETARASVKDGILTVTLEKAADAIPRQISVKAGH